MTMHRCQWYPTQPMVEWSGSMSFQANDSKYVRNLFTRQTRNMCCDHPLLSYLILHMTSLAKDTLGIPCRTSRQRCPISPILHPVDKRSPFALPSPFSRGSLCSTYLRFDTQSLEQMSYSRLFNVQCCCLDKVLLSSGRRQLSTVP